MPNCNATRALFASWGPKAESQQESGRSSTQQVGSLYRGIEGCIRIGFKIQAPNNQLLQNWVKVVPAQVLDKCVIVRYLDA